MQVARGGNFSHLTGIRSIGFFVQKNMNQELFFGTLDTIHQTSPGLKAYLNVALQPMEIIKHETLAPDHHEQFPLTFIEKGNLKTVLDSRLNPENRLVRIHFQGEILPRFIHEDNDDFILKVEALEDSRLILIPRKHAFMLYQNFPELHILIEKISGIHLSQLLHHMLDLQMHDVPHRLENLLSWKADIFQIAPINDVARFLGTHPNNLSAIRNKKT